MDENEFTEFVAEAIWAEAENRGIDYRTQTYDEAGVMTNNAGMVVTVDGVEFQVTVVRSR